MSCPLCAKHELYVVIPAIGDQEPIMGCACGARLDATVTELYMDREEEPKAA